MPDTDPNENQPDIADLRARADRASAAEAASAAKDREIAFLQAGVDTSTLLGRNIMQAHGDGEISKEAIEATTVKVREELGLPDPAAQSDPPPADPPASPSPEDQLAAAQAQLHGGAVAPGSQPPPVPKTMVDLAADTYTEARRNGLDDVKAQEAAIGEIIRSGATQEGSPARYDEGKFRAEAAQFGHGAEYAGLPERSYEFTVQQSKAEARQR